MVLICPYCDIEINEKLIEQEDGCCPECGALITANTVITEDDEYDDEFGDDEYDDEENEDNEEDLDEFDDLEGYDDEDYK